MKYFAMQSAGPEMVGKVTAVVQLGMPVSFPRCRGNLLGGRARLEVPFMNGGKAMAGHTEHVGGRRGNRWRVVIWGTAAVILLLPWVAMQFTEAVAWDLADFALFGAMLVGACGTYELAARARCNTAYRAAAGVALASAFILVWMNLAVGIIGNEGNPANVMYGGVLAVGVIGAMTARFQPQGMSRALVATALTQTMVAVIALIAGLGNTLILTGFFVALWLTSALLFRKAARFTS